MKYKVQLMDTDFNTVEFNLESDSPTKAVQAAMEGIDPTDVLQAVVFEEGCNISLPVEPVDSYMLPSEPDRDTLSGNTVELMCWPDGSWIFSIGFYDSEYAYKGDDYWRVEVPVEFTEKHIDAWLADNN